MIKSSQYLWLYNWFDELPIGGEIVLNYPLGHYARLNAERAALLSHIHKHGKQMVTRTERNNEILLIIQRVE